MLALIAWSGPAAAGPILDSSAVSYNPGTGLYTYTYSLDLQHSYFVDSFYVLVARGSDQSGLTPVAQTAPAGWSFQSKYYSALPYPPVEVMPGGVYWSWSLPRLGPADRPDHLTFSFTTPAAPAGPAAGHDANFHYEIAFSVGACGEPTSAEVGGAFAPDLAATPEPSTLLLAGLGLTGAATTRWRRRWQRREQASA